MTHWRNAAMTKVRFPRKHKPRKKRVVREEWARSWIAPYLDAGISTLDYERAEEHIRRTFPWGWTMAAALILTWFCLS